MSMQSDVYAVHTTGTGDLNIGRTRVKGFMFTGDGTPGDVIFLDGGASGHEHFRFAVEATTTEVFYNLPDQGMVFDIGVYVVLPGGSSLTVFYG